jgi:signal transduction histidine kinase
MMSRKFTRWDKLLPNWILRLRWLLIGALILLIVVHETFELLRQEFNWVDFIEMVIYAIFLVIIGVLSELLYKSLSVQDHALNILNYKHKLSLELTNYQDWESLSAHLAKIPSTIAPLNNSCLFLPNPILDDFEIAATWSNTGNPDRGFTVCKDCLKKQTMDGFLFKPCPLHEADFPKETYYLQLYYGIKILAILQFVLQPGATLNSEQEDILRSISEEMGVALNAGLDRKRLSELQIIQASLAERRNVSHYLHDHLSQNLSYLCLKLDQLNTENGSLPLENFRPELTGMLEVANQAYDIVRRKLESTQPATIPLLMNYLAEYAHKISTRAHFEVEFRTLGKQGAILPNVQQAIFYVFQEALGNIEKHAGATKVVVLIEWCEKNLSLVIQDDGRGFDPDQIQSEKHFGLGIMQERISNINGSISFSSSQPHGTKVSISIPITPINLLIDENIKGSG